MGFSKVIHCSLSEGSCTCTSAGMQRAWSDLQTRSTGQCRPIPHPSFMSPAHIRKQSSFIAWHCIQPNKPSQEPEFTNQVQGPMEAATLLLPKLEQLWSSACTYSSAQLGTLEHTGLCKLSDVCILRFYIA